MTFEHISELNDLVEHLIDLLVVLVELLHKLHLVLVHVSVGLLVILLLVFLRHLQHLLPRLEYHLILDVRIGEDFDAELALFEGVLVIEEVPEHLQVVLDSLQAICLVSELLLCVLLFLLFLPQLGLHGLKGLKAVSQFALYAISHGYRFSSLI